MVLQINIEPNFLSNTQKKSHIPLWLLEEVIFIFHTLRKQLESCVHCRAVSDKRTSVAEHSYLVKVLFPG